MFNGRLAACGQPALSLENKPVQKIAEISSLERQKNSQVQRN